MEDSSTHTSTDPRPAWIRYLALEHDVVLLLVILLTLNFGEELWIRFIPQYLVVLGAGTWVVGLYDALKVVLGAIYAYPGGVLTDRYGFRRSLMLFTTLSSAGYLLLWAVPKWPVVLAGTVLYLAWSSLSLPTSFALIGARLAPQKRAMGLSVQAMIKRVPILVAPVVGGLLLDRSGVVEGVRAGLLVATLAAFAALLLVNRIREDHALKSKSAAPIISSPANSKPIFTAPLRALLISDILVRFCERIPFAFVVLYALNTVGVSASQFGWLTTIEMATAMACYIPVAHFSDRTSRAPFVLATFAFFTLFPLALLMGHSFAGLAAAFFIRGLKEFGDATRKALIVDLAPPEARGRTIGKYYLLRDLIVTSGSFLGAWLWSWSPAANFWVAAAVGVGGTLLYGFQLRRYEHPVG